MGLGSYILYLRAHKDGVTPREVAAELEMPEHYIHAIELEKHAGNADSRGKLSEYFDVPVEDFNDFARSTHARFMEILKKERRPQMGFLLMSGETLMGTVDGADTSIIKIVELNSGTKTILQRHAIKKWWPLKTRSERSDGGSDYRGNSDGRPPMRRPMGGPGGGGGRPPQRSGGFGGGGGGGRPPQRPGGPGGGGGGGMRPNNRPNPFNDRPPVERPERPEPGNERESMPRRAPFRD
jgi:hypothetical protein